jgi:hypothetical protein
MDNKHPLQTVLEAAGYKPYNYSGRAMYGRRCLAVTLDARKLGRMISSLLRECLSSAADGGEDDYDRIVHDIRDMRWDNMGMDMVYYWPDVPCTAVGEDEEDSEEDDEDSET